MPRYRLTIYIEFQHNWGVDTILQEKKSQDGIAKEYLKDGIHLSIMWTNRDASYLILSLMEEGNPVHNAFHVETVDGEKTVRKEELIIKENE